jgi:hypothetical protein
MTELMLQTKPAGDKFEVCDLVFDVDGVRFIRPAPAMGRSSGFYSNGRPRTNSSGIETCPAMAVIVPGLTRADHDLIGCTIDERGGPLGSWSAWLHHLDGAREAAKVTQPLVTVSVSAEAWLRSCRAKGQSPSLTSLNDYLNESFNQQMRSVLGSAQELVEGGIVPSTYVLAVTQEIGQDRANDVSDIALVRERSTGEPIVRPLAENLRIFREHAIALAAAYALREGVGIVRWNRNRRYGWS